MVKLVIYRENDEYLFNLLRSLKVLKRFNFFLNVVLKKIFL